MMYFIFALLILICILTVVCYALLVIASEEEKRAESYRQAKAKTEPQAEVTTDCRQTEREGE